MLGFRNKTKVIEFVKKKINIKTNLNFVQFFHVNKLIDNK